MSMIESLTKIVHITVAGVEISAAASAGMVAPLPPMRAVEAANAQPPQPGHVVMGETQTLSMDQLVSGFPEECKDRTTSFSGPSVPPQFQSQREVALGPVTKTPEGEYVRYAQDKTVDYTVFCVPNAQKQEVKKTAPSRASRIWHKRQSQRAR